MRKIRRRASEDLPDVQAIPTAIITSDIEIRNYNPRCRTDDHFAALERKIDFVDKLQKKYDCLVLDGGDLFDKKYKAHPSNELLLWAIRHLPEKFITVPGNHDLPGHTMENYSKSSMAILEEIGVLERAGCHFETRKNKNIVIYGFAYGDEIKNISANKSPKEIWVALIHTMVYHGNPPFPGCTGYEANDLLKKLSKFDLVITGHNHQQFSVASRGRILINPGSLMRNDSDQKNFEPAVFLWFAKTNTLQKVKVPIEKGVISTDHIESKNEKENRFSKLISKLGTKDDSTTIDFEKNLEIACQKVSEPISLKVWDYYNERS